MTTTPDIATTPHLAAYLRLVRAQAVVARRTENELAAVHGLAQPELLILMHLSRAPAGRLRRSDLAARLAKSPSSVTRLLGPLERVGLVAREEDRRDARAAYAVLTAAGRERVAEAGATLDRASRDALGALDPGDAARLAELLGRLTAGVPGDLAAPAPH